MKVTNCGAALGNHAGIYGEAGLFRKYEILRRKQNESISFRRCWLYWFSHSI